MTNTDNTDATPATPGGAESIQSPEAQDSAAGGVLSPPADVPGGRADDETPADPVQIVRDRVRLTAETLDDLLVAIDQLPASVQRLIGPSIQSARETQTRLVVSGVTLDAVIQENGVRRLQESGAETPEAVSIDMSSGDNGELVDGLVEVGADVVVHNEQGEEVDRADA